MSGSSLATPAAPAAPSAPSLRSKTVRGSLWTFGAFGAQKALQFASSVILRWFLPPPVFGLMYLVQGVLRGLSMFSDFGIQPAVIQNPRGDERRFLDTAWTLQVVRGVLLCLIAAAAAWPLRMVYPEHPNIVWLMLGVSAIPLLDGFTSTTLMTLQRHLEIRTLRLFELAVSTVGTALTIVLAWWTRSIWALVVGAVIGAMLKMGFSFLLIRGSSKRFAWDRAALHELFHFGKWIFLATAIGWVSMYADGFILGRLIDMDTLGVYTTALGLTAVISELITRQTQTVLYPAFCQVARESGGRLRSVYYRVRLRLDALALPAVGALFVAGDWLVALLFKQEYAAAGWMLRFLCIRTAMAVVLTPCETCLFSLGKTRYGMYRNAARAAWVILGVPIGYALGGLEGLLWAVALSEIPVLLVLWPAFRRFGLLDLRRELLGLVFFGVGMLLGHACLGFFSS